MHIYKKLMSIKYMNIPSKRSRTNTFKGHNLVNESPVRNKQSSLLYLSLFNRRQQLSRRFTDSGISPPRPLPMSVSSQWHPLSPPPHHFFFFFLFYIADIFLILCLFDGYVLHPPAPPPPSLYVSLSVSLPSSIVQELCESRGGRPGLSVQTSLLASVDVKNYWTKLTHWSQLVPNTSADIRGH